VATWFVLNQYFKHHNKTLKIYNVPRHSTTH